MASPNGGSEVEGSRPGGCDAMEPLPSVNLIKEKGEGQPAPGLLQIRAWDIKCSLMQLNIVNGAARIWERGGVRVKVHVRSQVTAPTSVYRR